MGNSPVVSIIIPTQRRPGSLAIAAHSALAQTGLRDAVELVIVDNDEIPSARDFVQCLARDASVPVIYVHEARSGVSAARNAAMAQARGVLIAFLDDDEEAPPQWLAGLLAVQRRFDADVVFGPVRGRAPQGPIKHRAYLERFFSREGPAEEGLIDLPFGCGNSLLRRAALPDPDQPFSMRRNSTGGEDDLLFGGMRAAGARFAWAPEAYVWEDPAPERLSLRYTIARAYAYGQGPTGQCAAANPPDRIGMVRWMLIGLGQLVVFGLLAVMKGLIRAPDFAFVLDRAARGLGKVFWGPPFKIHFYGRAPATRSAAVAASSSAKPVQKSHA